MSRPDDLAARFGLAVQHHQAGQLAEAERLYRAVLAAEPNHAGALNLLGVIAAQSGHGDAAVALIGRAIQLDAGNAGYHVNLGLAEQGRGRADVAAACYRRALDLQPGNADAHNNLGILLQNQGSYDAAAEHFERCLAAQPDHAEALINLSLAYRNLDRFEDAVRCGERALALRPTSADALNNIGIALENLDRLAEAAARFRAAITLRPGYAEAMNNLGMTLRRAGDIEAAQAQFAETIAVHPDFPEAQLNYAISLLMRGEYRAGWQAYEWRWFPRGGEKYRRPFEMPRWDGGEARGRTIFVWAEQGLGDSVQFCRFAPLLAARGWTVVIEAYPPLVRLFRSLRGIDAVVEYGMACPRADVHCPLMSLPHHLGIELAHAGRNIPYLTVAPSDAAAWSTRMGLRSDLLRVGLVWAGRVYNRPLSADDDHRRSIALDRLAPILAVHGVQFVSLQKECRPGEDPARFGMLDPMGEVRDLADTAAIVAALDLVIAVDTSVVHLAGALGKPVWLLNRFDSCWRWLRERDDSPWYPALRQFRQRSLGDWDGAVAAAAAALAELVAGRS